MSGKGVNSFSAFIALCAIFCVARAVAADDAPQGFRVCTQNLFRYGDRSTKGAQARKDRQRQELVERFQNAECEVVAVQEVYGETAAEAKQTLGELANAWGAARGKRVQALLGDTIDPMIRSGYLLPEGSRLIEAKSFGGEPLPRLQPLGPIGRFLRAPFLLVLEHPVDGKPQRFAILNIHLKSKSFSFKDPTGTSFETLRMEMAEAVRRIALREGNRQPRGTIVVLVGDRNSDAGSATAEILDGRRVLDDFKDGHCRLTEANEPQCGSATPHDPALVGLFETRRSSFSGEYRGGSYEYRGKQELIDEIYVPPSAVDSVRRGNGRFSIAFEGRFYHGSDHKLLWAEFQSSR